MILAKNAFTIVALCLKGKQVQVVKRTNKQPSSANNVNNDPVSTVSGSMVPLAGSIATNTDADGARLRRQRSLTEAMEHFFRKMSFKARTKIS